MIDTTEPFTPGWWMARLTRQLQAEQIRFGRLDAYRRGVPPLAMGSVNVRGAFYRFQQMARSNFADLIVQAMTERMAVRAIRTAVDSDEGGDQQAWRVWAANELDVDQTDVYRYMATFGRGYASVGMPAVDGGEPVIRAEDPRQTITAEDPVTRRTRAALKMFHDDGSDRDYVYLWLPGEMWVAVRDRKARPYSGVSLDAPVYTPVTFAPAAYTIDEVLSESYAVQDVPVVRFGNRDDRGEFELHLDLLDRINHVILQRVVIATLQAFRQRAIEVQDSADLPDVDDAGVPIDYDDLFSADPGALWRLPAGAKIWESGQVDLQGILASAKDDVLHLAAVTRTPFPMFSPDAANQSAEGAGLTREGLVFKVEDRDRICGRKWAKVASLAFQFKGDSARADLAGLSVDWTPAERYSLAERASADAQAMSLPFEQKLRIIWQLPPDEAARAVSQRADDMVFTQQLAAVQAKVSVAGQ
ncbi:MAG: phage portal protein [Gemmatimonadaceae bacterium]